MGQFSDHDSWSDYGSIAYPNLYSYIWVTWCGPYVDQDEIWSYIGPTHYLKFGWFDAGPSS